MAVQATLVVVGSGVAALAAWLVAAYCWHKRGSVPGVGLLGLTNLAGGCWAALYLGTLLAGDVASTYLWYRLTFVAGLGATVLLLLFVAVYTGREWFVSTMYVAVLSAFPVVLFVGMATNATPPLGGFHSLWWVDAGTTTVGSLLVPSPGRGPLLWAYRGYVTLVAVATIGLLVEYALRPEQRFYRRQNLLIVGAFVLPIGANLVTRLVGTPLDPTPITIVVAEIPVILAVFGDDLNFLDAAPVARESVVEELDGGVIVYDEDGVVVDVNQFAQDVLEIPDDAVGQSAEALLSERDEPDLAEAVARTLQVAPSNLGPASPGERPPGTDSTPAADGGSAEKAEFVVEDGGRERYFSARVSALTDDDCDLLGRALLFYEITERRRREEELDLLKGILTRVLRHNVRNDLTVVRSHAEMIAERSEQHAEAARTIVEMTDDVVAMSEKARTIEKAVGKDRSRTPVDVTSVLERELQALRSNYPAATVEADLPGECWAYSNWGIDVAVENLLENAVVHNDSETPSVSVSVHELDESVEVRVEDDGPGIPRQEVAVLERGEESPLEHGSGVGLWLVDWIVDRAGGELRFEDTREGTRVTVRLEPAPSRE